MPENFPSVGVTRLTSIAVNVALVGLVCVLLFLWNGMGSTQSSASPKFLRETLDAASEMSAP